MSENWFTEKFFCAIMNSLGKENKATETQVESKEEQRISLPSSEDSSRCSSFDCKINRAETTPLEEVDILAKLLVDIFFELQNEKHQGN